MSHSPPQRHRAVHFNALSCIYIVLSKFSCTHSEAILWMRHLTQVVWSTVVPVDRSQVIRSWYVSTSSWLHGARLLVCCGGMHMIFVVTICLVTTICDICFTKKETALFCWQLCICSNCCQLPCRLATHLVIPFPRLLLVCDFKRFS